MATWEVQGNYGYGHGWETVDAAETEEEAYTAMAVYRENEPHARHRVVLEHEDDEISYPIIVRLLNG